MPKGRQATVYDAVAGRVSTYGFYTAHNVSHQGDTISTAAAASTPQHHRLPLYPEDVLLRREGAPPRFEEEILYEADRRLPPGRAHALPDSDLVKALHAYASDFYYCATRDRGRTDWRTLDGTALLALGILMEETAREVLGPSGDLVFLEGEEVSIVDEDSAVQDPAMKEEGGSAEQDAGIADDKKMIDGADVSAGDIETSAHEGGSAQGEHTADGENSSANNEKISAGVEVGPPPSKEDPAQDESTSSEEEDEPGKDEDDSSGLPERASGSTTRVNEGDSDVSSEHTRKRKRSPDEEEALPSTKKSR